MPGVHKATTQLLLQSCSHSYTKRLRLDYLVCGYFTMENNEYQNNVKRGWKRNDEHFLT